MPDVPEGSILYLENLSKDGLNGGGCFGNRPPVLKRGTMTEQGFMNQLQLRIQAAKKKHPYGPGLPALVEEVGEVARCFEDRLPVEQLVDELLDVATVAVRMAVKYYNDERAEP